MSVNQAAEQLLTIIQNRRLQGEEPGTVTAVFLGTVTAVFLSATSLLSSHLVMSP